MYPPPFHLMNPSSKLRRHCEEEVDINATKENLITTIMHQLEGVLELCDLDSLQLLQKRLLKRQIDIQNNWQTKNKEKTRAQW